MDDPDLTRFLLPFGRPLGRLVGSWGTDPILNEVAVGDDAKGCWEAPAEGGVLEFSLRSVRYLISTTVQFSRSVEEETTHWDVLPSNVLCKLGMGG